MDFEQLTLTLTDKIKKLGKIMKILRDVFWKFIAILNYLPSPVIIFLVKVLIFFNFSNGNSSHVPQYSSFKLLHYNIPVKSEVF